MEYSILLPPLVIGLIIWYLYFSFETALNGGMGNGWSMAFRYWYHDFRSNLPWSGFKYRLKLTDNDVEWASMMPGPIHFVLTHIAIPFGPCIYQYYTKLA